MRLRKATSWRNSVTPDAGDTTRSRRAKGFVEIVWSPAALARLQEIRAFVALDKPKAAQRLAMRIVAVVESLRQHPYLGRAGADSSIRELVIGGTPYVVLYRVSANRVTVLTVWHGAQRK
jgi:plasmid stabilization system protein ParE